MDAAGPRPRDRTDGGATLIEVLVALSILSIAGVAILAGLQLSVKTSDIHRKQSTGGAYVRSYAEAIEKHLDTTANYQPCAGANAYTPVAVGFVVPSGFTATHTAAEPLAGNGTAASGGCPGADTGVQRITVTVRSNDSRATEVLTLVVRRACGTGSSCA